MLICEEERDIPHQTLSGVQKHSLITDIYHKTSDISQLVSLVNGVPVFLDQITRNQFISQILNDMAIKSQNLSEK